jgi:hypothetical protein
VLGTPCEKCGAETASIFVLGTKLWLRCSDFNCGDVRLAEVTPAPDPPPTRPAESATPRRTDLGNVDPREFREWQRTNADALNLHQAAKRERNRERTWRDSTARTLASLHQGERRAIPVSRDAVDRYFDARR